MDGDVYCGVAYAAHNGWHALAVDQHGMSGGPGWNSHTNAYSTRAHAEAATIAYWRKQRGV
jgi:hypothetical protein